MQIEESPQKMSHIVRNTLLVSVLFGFAAGAGLIRNIIIAQTFGIGADLDAYYAAFKLPDLLFTIVAGGALATAFIPVFANFLAANDLRGAWRLSAAITNLVVAVVGVFAILAGLFAPWLVSAFIAPGFNPAQQAETVTVMRLVLVSTVIFGISAVQGSVLHGFNHFLLPALGPVLYPLGIAAGALWLAPTMGISGLALGAVIGATLHLLVKVPGLIYYGFKWRPVFDLRTQAVKRVLVLMGPRILDLAVFHFTLLATTNLASRLPAGSVSALEWGWDAMQLPETIIGTAFGLVAFPTLAALASAKNIDGLRHTFSETLRMILVLTIPAAVGLILLGRPMLTFLYQRGAFDASATQAVFIALSFYTLGLVGHVCLELAARAFFAQEDTVTPLFVAMASAGLNIGLALLLLRPMGYAGLALSNSVAVSLEVLVLLLILRQRWGHIEGRETGQTALRSVIASGVMGVVIFAAITLAGSITSSPLLILIIGGIAGAITYLVMAFVLKISALYRLPLAFLGKV